MHSLKADVPVYIDDIIYGNSCLKHMQHVRAFLQSSRPAVLIANPRSVKLDRLGYHLSINLGRGHISVTKLLQKLFKSHHFLNILLCCVFKFEWGKLQPMNTYNNQQKMNQRSHLTKIELEIIHVHLVLL